MCLTETYILYAQNFISYTRTYKIHRLKPKEMATDGRQSWPVLFSADRTLGLWV